MFSRAVILPQAFKKSFRNISWFRGNQESADNFPSVVEGMKRIYRTKLLPLEECYNFHEFHSLRLNDPDFESKPLVLFIGQYSTGKTTLIKYMINADFPGGRIGPEPTTDRFIAVMHGEQNAVIPGNALVVDPSRPFAPLAKFGNSFLTKFQCSVVPSPILKNISFIDTPGILSGEKQRVDRGYDFMGVLEWFAERVDRIILLFDAHKLDISDEFQRSIEALRGHDEKIRIVLNKADLVDHQALMRVYGALMWSLGKILNTPEVARVYVGSFWKEPLLHTTNKQLFDDEARDLFCDLQSLPKDAALRRLNDLSKRARQAKVHAYTVDAIARQMPTLLGREAKKREIIANLKQLFKEVEKKWDISPGDFPEVGKMQRKLEDFDFNRMTSLNQQLIQLVDKMLSKDITRLMAMISSEEFAPVGGDQKLQGEYCKQRI